LHGVDRKEQQAGIADRHHTTEAGAHVVAVPKVIAHRQCSVDVS